MANSNGWGDGAANNAIGWGQGANNAIAWGDSHAKSWAGATDIVGFDASSISYFNATGITGATQQDAIDNLIRGLKADGLWSKMKAVYPFVTDNKNLLSYTEDFTRSSYWGKDAGVTATSNTTTAPDGTNTADTITLPLDATSAIYTQPAVTALTTYTVSFYIKATSGEAGNTVCFRTNPGLTTNMITLTNDWVRYSVVVTPTSGTWSIEWGRKNSATATSFYLWGAQLELGSTATTYQPIATTQQAYIASQFKYNLVNPVDSDAAFRLVFNGGWTHSSTGATPNGTNGYADTKLVPSSSLSTSSAHLSYYSRTNVNQASYDLSSSQHYSLLLYQNKFYVNLETSGQYNATQVLTNTTGYYIGSRINNTNVNGYRNGIKTINNIAQNSTLSAQPLFLAATNNGQYFSSKQVAFTSIGDGLTDIDATNLYSRVNTFQVALSRNV